jgi:phosphatidylserine/phosphatidylglycerophosphate/cardiolipin synthase-like enzyme
MWTPTTFHTLRDTAAVTLKAMEDMQYSFHATQYQVDHDEMFLTLLNKLGQGMMCYILLDKGNFYKSSCARQSSRVSSFFHHGGHLRIMTPAKGGAFSVMHAKSIVIDGRVLLTGSVNMTNNGHTNNKEHLFRSEEPALIHRVMEDFAKEWGDAEKVTGHHIEMMEATHHELQEKKDREYRDKSLSRDADRVRNSRTKKRD